MKKNWKNNKQSLSAFMSFSVIILLYVALGYTLFSLITDMTSEEEKIEEITYNEFTQFVDAGHVDTIVYNTTEEYMTVYLYNEETINMTKEERKEYEYSNDDIRYCLFPAYENFRVEMLEKDINLVFKAPENMLGTLSTIVSIFFPVAMVAILLILSNKGLGTGGNFSEKLIQTSDVKFDAVIGHDEILDDIKFITKLIQDPTIGDSVGAKVPKGILLSGDPGTGKTLIAKAIAGEADVPFLYVNASSFIELFVGVGAKRVREVFATAKKHAPCIIFIDEIDAIGGKRDGRSVGHSEHEQTIDALLQEMDGFTGRDGVFIIAATNRPDKLDSALTRAGRFDRQIIVNKPRGWKVRAELFKHYLNNFKVSDDVDIETLSKQVSGFTGADIAAICNDASIVAVMHEKAVIDNACIEEAIDKKVFKGNRSKEDHFATDKNIVAYHEAGHAVMSYLTNQPITRASIIGTTSGVGGAVWNADSDSCFITDLDMLNKVKVAYAGRASEEIKFSSKTTGASNDITQATNLLTCYVQKYGFDSEVGLLDMDMLANTVDINEFNVAERVSSLAKDLYDDTMNALIKNYSMVEILAQKLLEIETLSGDEILKLLETTV